MESERLRITLDHPDKVYYAGETIKGNIWLNLTKRTKIRTVKVQITGKGKCKWMEIMRKSSANNESARSLFYSSKEVYVHNESPLAVFEPRGLELSPGEHSFDFEMPLNWNLPSSFKGSYGSIKYKLRILIQRPWTFDERHIIPLTLVKHMPLSPCYRVNPTSLEKQITKTISLFGMRPITMLALLPEDCAVRGEPMRICVTVTNNSTTTVEKLRFSVLQYIWYYSHVPLRIQKMECVSIAQKETGAVHKKSERSFAHELLMPATAQPTDCELSGVINISYELRVEAVLRGFFKNLVLNLPFKVYSAETATPAIADEAPAPPQPPPPRPPVTYTTESVRVVGAGNPFEPPTAASLPVYTSIDSAIGSPSHSSQYSESSSITSTTSDSSAATLSPAVGGNELAYMSSSSSQFGSPATRVSIHSSNVPYMPYSNSPQMVSSYPPAYVTPYPPAEASLYPVFPPLRTTPSMSRHQLSNSSLDRFLVGRHPPGAHELPPSYEELFGNATAPPVSPK